MICGCCFRDRGTKRKLLEQCYSVLFRQSFVLQFPNYKVDEVNHEGIPNFASMSYQICELSAGAKSWSDQSLQGHDGLISFDRIVANAVDDVFDGFESSINMVLSRRILVDGPLLDPAAFFCKWITR